MGVTPQNSPINLYTTKAFNTMNILIFATLTLTVAYFVAGFIAHIHDAIIARMPQKPQLRTEYFPEDDTWLFDDIVESDRLYGTCGNPGIIFRPAPVVAKSGVIQYCSIRQLKRLAKGQVKNYSNLTKPELIAALS
jgi:hypothetical protein